LSLKEVSEPTAFVLNHEEWEVFLVEVSDADFEDQLFVGTSMKGRYRGVPVYVSGQ
jgi:hypothetical protein